MQTVLFGGGSDALSNTASEFNAISGISTWNTTVSQSYIPIPTDGKLKNLAVKLSAAPTTNPYVFTIYANGTATELLGTVAVGSTTMSNDVTELTVQAGSVVAIRSSYPGAPGNTPYASYSCVFESDTAGESIILGHGNRSVAGTYYAGLHNASKSALPTSNVAGYRTRIPTPGTLTKMYAYLSITDTGTIDYTLYQQGTATALKARVVNGVYTPGTASVTVADDNYCQMRFIEVSNVAAAQMGWGMVFRPATDGEFIVTLNTSDDPSTTANEYHGIVSNLPTTAWGATEATFYTGACAWTAKKMRFAVNTAPGSGKTRVVTLRKEAANTSMAVTLSDSGTSDASVVDVGCSQFSRVSLMHTPTGTPTAAAGFQISIVGSAGMVTPSNIKSIMGGSVPAKIYGSTWSSICGVVK